MLSRQQTWKRYVHCAKTQTLKLLFFFNLTITQRNCSFLPQNINPLPSNQYKQTAFIIFNLPSSLFLFAPTTKLLWFFIQKGGTFCPQKTWGKSENKFTWLLVLKGSSHLKYCLLSFKQVRDVPWPGRVTWWVDYSPAMRSFQRF